MVERDGRFLMIRRADHLEDAPGYWTPTGGRIEPGESPEQAVVREMAEEVGVVVRPLRALAETDSAAGDYRLHWWLAEITSGEARPSCDEVAELRWLTLHELRAMEPVFAQDLEVMERSLGGESCE